MDLWVVAAATGAGYLTKYWQKLSRERDKDDLLHFPIGDGNLEKAESQSSSFTRRGDRKPVVGERAADMNVWGGVSKGELASTSGYDVEKLASLESYHHCNVLSLSNISPVYQANIYENGNESRQSTDIDDNTGAMLPKASNGENGSSLVPLRNRRSVRTEHSHGHIVKPLNSLESCLMAQLYIERAESSVLTLPSPSNPSMRPLIVSDGSRIISRANGDHFSAQIGMEENKLHKEDCFDTNENASSIPLLPKLGFLDLPKKMKIETGKGQTGRSHSSGHMASGTHLHVEGSPDGAVLLCLGVSIGVISSFLANKKEVDKLKDVLKQTKSLVEDLQEELEMKDSVMVKELANENYGSQVTCANTVFNRALNPISHEQNMDKHDGRDSYDPKAEESLESMSKIEAELEAELERLGLNMNTSTLEGKLTDLDELDPKLMADFAQGELRADMVGGHNVALPESNENASSRSTAHHYGNYVVSPRELSLHLHEVIQSRLEERIQELEAALESSQKEDLIVELELKDCSKDSSDSCVQSTIQEGTNSNDQSEFIIEPPAMMSALWNQNSQKVCVMESEHKDCSRDNSCVQSTIQDCTNFKEQRATTIEPLVMNLAGEALHAYNEAYEELMKLSESEGEDSPCQVIETFSDQMCKQTFDVNGSLGHFAFEEEKWLEDEHISRFDYSVSEEDSRSDDEMEKHLIQQIVEKTKKGSPVVLNAQKWLFSMNDYETEL
ncbi:uncharacterized protein LOC126794275 [Argentina anserina]|uniref:uncharacterized protein LOC126794275 n=1 Tax=Argentina anserina TaxID=57926 RepID=UPI00217682DD|nr:uncharacterized protein LOC126794275 [Potentilla anserina]XP_050376900.1 uncharacterized protein LOC126794275 [Potentilla anserina]